MILSIYRNNAIRRCFNVLQIAVKNTNACLCRFIYSTSEDIKIMPFYQSELIFSIS